MGYNPQEALENTINTVGTLLGVHPIVPWMVAMAHLYGLVWLLVENGTIQTIHVHYWLFMYL